MNNHLLFKEMASYRMEELTREAAKHRLVQKQTTSKLPNFFSSLFASISHKQKVATQPNVLSCKPHICQ
jgi:hypothetical protein